MEPLTPAEEASKEAAHKAKSAQQAVESAREAQLEEAIKKTAVETKAALLEGLKEVFNYPDREDPKNMIVLFDRIPLLCKSVKEIHANISSMEEHLDANTKATEKINNNLSRVVWLVLTAVIVAVLKLVLIP